MNPQRIVIIGAGLAGATAAVTLREEGFDGEIHLIGGSNGAGSPPRRTSLKALSPSPHTLTATFATFSQLRKHDKHRPGTSGTRVFS